MLLFLALQGMVILFGGTRFWASGPFLLPILLLAGAGLLLMAAQNRRDPGRLHVSVELWLLAGLSVYCVVRAVTDSAVPYETWTEAYLWACAAVLWVTFLRLGSVKSAWILFSVGMVGFALMHSMVAVWQHASEARNVLWLERPEHYGMRASGTFICPNHFGHYLQLAAVLGSGLFVAPGMKLSVRIFSGYALCFILPASVLTLSRATILGLLAGVGVLILLILIYRKSWRLCLAGVAGAVITGLTFALLYAVYEPIRGRFRDFGTSNMRWTQIWPDTWSMIQGEGFWGSGPGTYLHVFDQYREKFNSANHYLEYAHNEYLNTLAEYGWIPLLLILVFSAWICVRLVRASLRAPTLRVAVIPMLSVAIWTATLVHALFDFQLHIPSNALLTVMVLAILHGAASVRGLWPGSLWSPATSGVFLAATGVLGLMLILPTIPLSMGSYYAYQARLAREANQAEESYAHAARVRSWLPMRYDGWRTLGLEKRSQAFWMRDPERRAALIEESRSAYHAALERNPYDRISRAGIIELLKMEKKWEEALTELDTLIHLAPFDVQVRVQQGLVLRRLGRYPEALKVFQLAKGLRHFPDRQIEANLRLLRAKIRQETP